MTGNLLISKDGQTFQTPILHCVTSRPGTVEIAGTMVFDTVASELHISDGTKWIYFLFESLFFFPIVITIKKKHDKKRQFPNYWTLSSSWSSSSNS